MRIVTTAAVATAAILMTLAGTSASFAKGHDNGFGAGLAGRDTAGKVDDGQSNRGGMGASTAYGTTDASQEAKSGTQDNSGAAQASGNPSDRR